MIVKPIINAEKYMTAVTLEWGFEPVCLHVDHVYFKSYSHLFCIFSFFVLSPVFLRYFFKTFQPISCVWAKTAHSYIVLVYNVKGVLILICLASQKRSEETTNKVFMENPLMTFEWRENCRDLSHHSKHNTTWLHHLWMSAKKYLPLSPSFIQYFIQ